MAPLGIWNWSHNLQYKAHTLHEPRTVAEVQDIVKRSAAVRVLGSRHCFNSIADAEELISLCHMKDVVKLDEAAQRVTVQAGITYGELCQGLQARGFALHNLASLPHISVAGAVATATHGSGQGNSNLATAVAGLQLVTGRGDVVSLSEDGDAAELHKALVGLGCLGVVTEITLKLQPSFQIRQRVFDGLFLADLTQDRLDAVLGGAYSVSLFTMWEASRDAEFHVWLKQRLPHSDGGADLWPNLQQLTEVAGAPLHGCVECSDDQHPLKGMDASNCTDQQSPGPWHERLPHFRFEFQPSVGEASSGPEELQSEYFVPRAFALESLRAVHAIAPVLEPQLLVSEVRSIAADSLLLSPHAARHVGAEGSVGLHFTWRGNQEEVMTKVLPVLERALEPFQARPHWGKLFTTSRDRLEQLYGTALPEFQQARLRYDPDGRLCNDWIRQVIGVSRRQEARL